jgi:hypothetical protein
VGEWYREHLLEESEQAKAMLAKYKEGIAEQVSQVRELTDFDLGINTLAGMLGGTKSLEIGKSIERVNSLNLEDIESAVWRDKDKPESRILFRILCAAHVTRKSSTFHPFLATSSTYAVGGGKSAAPSIFTAFSPRQEREQERTLSVWLYGEAVFVRTNEDWKLLRIKVDKSEPSEDEMMALLRVPRRKA